MMHKCGKDVVECECEGALDRLRWLLSDESPCIIAGDYRPRALRRLLELEGEQELELVGKEKTNPIL